MKLIEDLGTERQKNGKWLHFGYFFCKYCKKQSKKILSSGLKAKGCGCFESKITRNNYKHGETNTKIYAVWCTIKNRCLNPKNKQYKDYGGRGITICNEWLEFIPFRDWSLSNGYSEGLTINRKINDGNYEPLNCEWITSAENNRNKRNKRNNKYTLEIIKEIRALWNTGNYTQKELAEKYNTTNKYIYKIINNKIWKN